MIQQTGSQRSPFKSKYRQGPNFGLLVDGHKGKLNQIWVTPQCGGFSKGVTFVTQVPKIQALGHKEKFLLCPIFNDLCTQFLDLCPKSGILGTNDFRGSIQFFGIIGSCLPGTSDCFASFRHRSLMLFNRRFRLRDLSLGVRLLRSSLKSQRLLLLR